MDSEYHRLAETIRHQASAHSKPRYIVAIAGIPGSGKTTTAAAVVDYLNSENGSASKTALLSMDGFHLSRRELDQLPNAKEAYIRRGAPWTFDVSRFVKFMHNLRSWADNTPLSPEGKWEPEHVLTAPTFDHEAKDPAEDGISITPDASIIIVEGNYLLLDEPGWRDLASLCDYRVFVEADIQEARDRTAKRHVKAGIEKTLEEGYRRVDSNDYLNGISIQEKLIMPDMVVKSVSVNGAIILNELGKVLEQDEQAKICSKQAFCTAQEVLTECKAVFQKIEGALEKYDQETEPNPIRRGARKISAAFAKPDLDILKSNLERLKTTTLLMLHVIMYAGDLRKRANKSKLIDQHHLIQTLMKERRESDHTITDLNETIQTAATGVAHQKEPDSKDDSLRSLDTQKQIIGLPKQLEEYYHLIQKLLQDVDAYEHSFEQSRHQRIRNGIVNVHSTEVSILSDLYGNATTQLFDDPFFKFDDFRMRATERYPPTSEVQAPEIPAVDNEADSNNSSLKTRDRDMVIRRGPYVKYHNENDYYESRNIYSPPRGSEYDMVRRSDAQEDPYYYHQDRRRQVRNFDDRSSRDWIPSVPIPPSRSSRHKRDVDRESSHGGSEDSMIYTRKETRDGEEISSGFSHSASITGADSLDAMIVNADAHYRDYYRSKSRSRSHSRSRTRSRTRAIPFQDLGLGAAAVTAGVAALRNNKENEGGSDHRGRSRTRSHSRCRSRSRSRSRQRDRKLSATRSEEDGTGSEPQPRQYIVGAGLGGAAVAGLIEHNRNKSRLCTDERSQSPFRKALPVLAAGTGTAAATGFCETKNTKNEDRESVGSYRHRGSRSRSHSSGIYPYPSRYSAGLIEYGSNPVSGSIPAEHYYGAVASPGSPYYPDGVDYSYAHHHNRGRGSSCSNSSRDQPQQHLPCSDESPVELPGSNSPPSTGDKAVSHDNRGRKRRRFSGSDLDAAMDDFCSPLSGNDSMSVELSSPEDAQEPQTKLPRRSYSLENSQITVDGGEEDHYPKDDFNKPPADLSRSPTPVQLPSQLSQTKIDGQASPISNSADDEPVKVIFDLSNFDELTDGTGVNHLILQWTNLDQEEILKDLDDGL